LERQGEKSGHVSAAEADSAAESHTGTSPLKRRDAVLPTHDSGLGALNKPEHVGDVHKKALGEVLDLATFMNRTGVYFEQLRRADLPATGMLIEAQWDIELDANDRKDCWNTVLGLIQSQLRGIDVVCIYRANTAGVFLPGCSIEAASERASRIQMLLETSRKDWQPVEHCPDRLSVSIAQAVEREETGEFLQRLEGALDEAADAGRFELVIHNGQCTRLESTIQA
jgi:hypothetical protein